MTKRRTFLYGATAFAAASTWNGLSRVQAGDRHLITAKQSTPAPRPLRSHAANRGLVYGAAIETSELENRAFADLVAQECGILVPENELKWRVVRPSPNQFNFAASDRLLAVAQRHQMLFRGHTLVWHSGNPDWLKETTTRANAEQRLVDHITRVAGRYAGKVHSWDVVNEAIDVGAEGVNGLRNSFWLQTLGADYIDLAFQTAAAADPEALLVYNDYGLDIDSDDQIAKRAQTLRLLERLKSRNIPVQALGTQAHLWAGEARFNPESLRTFLRDVASLGLKILITELDVVDRNLPQSLAERDRQVADTYRAYLDAALDEPAVIAVLTWGLSDRYTWLSRARARADGAPVRPLPFDTAMQLKPAAAAIAAAFDAAPRR